MNNTQKKSSSKSWIIMIVVIVIAAGAYFYYQGQATPTDSLLTVDDTSVVVGANVLSLLNQIQSLKIDTSIFKSPVYQSLIDYSIPIPTLPVGRPDPFAPIPGFVEQTAPVKR
jgi:hypothetical protein